jgi:CubicO group peptidase (beta-lactamase class C family)
MRVDKPFDDTVRDMLFNPLGLRSTFFATPGNTKLARFLMERQI